MKKPVRYNGENDLMSDDSINKTKRREQYESRIFESAISI